MWTTLVLSSLQWNHLITTNFSASHFYYPYLFQLDASSSLFWISFLPGPLNAGTIIRLPFLSKLAAGGGTASNHDNDHHANENDLNSNHK